MKVINTTSLPVKLTLTQQRRLISSPSPSSSELPISNSFVSQSLFSVEMQRIARAVRSYRNTITYAGVHHTGVQNTNVRPNVILHFEYVASSPAMRHRGLENTTVSEILMAKGEDRIGCVLCCRTDESVYDAVKQMAQNDVGSLVVLKPGEQKLIAGIITERDYLKKIIAQGRSSTLIRVGDIMTEENKLITVTSDTNILKAMQLMTENQIRHVPVIDRKLVGMISIVDVVRAVVEQQSEEVKRLNEFIKGEYY